MKSKITYSVGLQMFLYETYFICFFHIAVVGLCHLSESSTSTAFCHVINPPEDFVNRHWQQILFGSVTDVDERATISDPTETVSVLHKKLFTIVFNLFCTVLIYFNKRSISLVFCFFNLKRKKMLFVSFYLHMNYHHVNSVFSCGTFWSTVQVSVSVYTMTS